MSNIDHKSAKEVFQDMKRNEMFNILITRLHMPAFHMENFALKTKLEDKKELYLELMKISKKDLCALKIENSMNLIFSPDFKHPDTKYIIEYNEMIDYVLAEKAFNRRDLYKRKK